MPSTFSPSLRLELMADGENTGLWGQKTNTNLGTLLEQAITGYTTVNVTAANQAFLHANGAADEARRLMINVTVSFANNVSVFAPPVAKQYIIRNASTTRTVTIYNSTVTGNTTAAGVGVAIPPSSTRHVWSDGTNFLQLTYDETNVMKTTAYNSDALLFLSSPSSSNLESAIGDGTGTGSVVFNSSPLISSPTFTSPRTDTVLENTLNAGVTVDGVLHKDNETSAQIFNAVGTAGASGRYRMYERTGTGTNYIELQGPASVGSNKTLTLPDSVGTAGQALVTDGAGNLSFGFVVTKFESSELAIPALNGATLPATTQVTVTAAHGGPRKPDMFRVVIRRNSTAGVTNSVDASYLAGDEVTIVDSILANQLALAVWANASTCGYSQLYYPPNIAYKGSNFNDRINVDCWRIVFYAAWF